MSKIHPFLAQIDGRAVAMRRGVLLAAAFALCFTPLIRPDVKRADAFFCGHSEITFLRLSDKTNKGWPEISEVTDSKFNGMEWRVKSGAENWRPQG